MVKYKQPASSAYRIDVFVLKLHGLAFGLVSSKFGARFPVTARQADLPPNVQPRNASELPAHRDPVRVYQPPPRKRVPEHDGSARHQPAAVQVVVHHGL